MGSYDLIISDDFTLITFSGKVGYSEMVNAMKDLFNSPDYKEPIVALDFRNVEGDLSTNELLALINFAKENRGEHLGYGKTAVVISSAVHFGIGRMYQSFGADLPFDIEIFEQLEKAKEWLLK